MFDFNVWINFAFFKSPLGGEVAGSEGGETTPAAGGAPAEGEEGKDEVVYLQISKPGHLINNNIRIVHTYKLLCIPLIDNALIFTYQSIHEIQCKW